MTTVTDFTDPVLRNVETVIIGKRPQLEMLLIARVILLNLSGNCSNAEKITGAPKLCPAKCAFSIFKSSYIASISFAVDAIFKLFLSARESSDGGHADQNKSLD